MRPRWCNRITGLVAALVVCAGVAPARTQNASKEAPSKHTVAAKTSKKAASSKKARKSTKSRRPKGQQAIASPRVREIQEALIRERYMDGEADGIWDQRTKTALVRYQGDNNWQTKVVPDSRALIKLGLGPDQSNLINPDTAVTSATASAGRR